MIDQQALLRVLSDFAHRLVGEHAISDCLHDLVEGATEVLGITGAGVSLVGEDGRLRFATAANDIVGKLERVQEDAQSGPCMDAHNSGNVVTLEDFSDDPDRWPAIAGTAEALGIVSAAGVPMHVAGTAVGALNLYHSQRRAWSDEDLEAGRLLAEAAAAYMANASTLQRAQRIAEQLQEALDSRVVIEQAKGVVAAGNDVSVDEAFRLLRNHARSHRASLRSVANAVVNLGLRISDPTTTG